MLYYAYGTALLSRDEVYHTGVEGKIQAAVAGRIPGSAGSLDLLNGALSIESIVGTGTEGLESLSAEAVTPWEPLGLGKPLTIDIRELYTGKEPGGWMGDSKPMLVTSAVKSSAVFDAKPKAINFQTTRTERYSRLNRPRASETGTPVVFYSPAILDRSLTVDVSVVFNKFNQEWFDVVGGAFKAAAGVPVFLTHSAYLLAAGEITRIAGAIGEQLFDGEPAFEASEAIDILLPGTTPAVAGFMLLTPRDVDAWEPHFRTNYHVADGKLVDAHGAAYGGDMPYVILAVDGTNREDLASFAPTASSAAVLSKFYGLNDGNRLSLDPLLDALKLYNDFRYRTELDKLDAQIGREKDSAAKEQLAEKRAALLKNIVTDVMKPQSA